MSETDESESHVLKPESSQTCDNQVNDEIEQNENDQTALIHPESSSSSRAKWYRILVTIFICCGEFAYVSLKSLKLYVNIICHLI